MFLRLLISTSAIAGALTGCASVEFYAVPEGRPQSELTVAMPAGSSPDSYVLVSAYKQAESCVDSKLMNNRTATPVEPAVNPLEAGHLQTIRLTLVRRTTSGHQVQCSSMLSFLPQADTRYHLNPMAQGWQCAPVIWQRDTHGALIRTEHKVRTPTPSGFFSNKSDCADKMVLN
jgi:hypothetical protein